MPDRAASESCTLAGNMRRELMGSVQEVGHSYGSREALCDITSAVRPGEVFGILGPNGSGKSTLFRILSTLMLPSRGRAEIGGYELTRDVMQVRRQIGVVFQSQTMDEQLTMVENLRCHGRMYGISGTVLDRRIEAVLDWLGLADRCHEKMSVFSGGQRRQIDVTKATLHQPHVLLLDEPSSGLDPGARIDLWQQLTRLKEQNGTTVLFTTHILTEADRCDRLLILNRGRIVAGGTPAELRSRVRGDVVVIEVTNLEGMKTDISVRFNVQPVVLNGALRLEIANGSRFMGDLIEAFPRSIQSVAVHKPSLEDVFVHETGTLMEEVDEKPT